MNKQVKVIASIIIVTIVVIMGSLSIYLYREKIKKDLPIVNNFQECVNAVGLVKESYPRQCSFNGQNFTEDIGEKQEKSDLIIVENPRPNQVIQSPLFIKGKARGTWFFEASFSVVLVNWDGLIIAQGLATAKEDWMTEEFVLFEANLYFTIDKDTYSNRGALILKKDNPSGLPEYDDALEMPIIFADVLNKN
ncbi:MAG: hypothetical protein A2312_01195 [Candidatus Staskawiczbacteria bacterium RIFOXYB2_FULL_32_9]|uniref:Bacterial spore germination immunoglobulin-like domain-containing protein n=1 Tax=Candidatus Staskawiczbacteria bacterium RIFOXYD1_FULL_32_13 TaxID=1802234 RepID=A0A1G2JPX6_9BACT|nr:MAG: hypothetical protein UR22_C0003G0024 [Parcubacteria group bacterium GW2011_GWC2_32_10]OGZ78359.1 MAG: hypothetical protein A2360_03505 [Candidatus Staskawiczbacteria bacterium RIFOXYB1_FULL_32_11]OGZ81332.1 MAG: hypothetical protein A2312_01195 [Candidatus Staskawiczbacteria bacterium RIFOXYB2_FULL_32_9]OGZ86722.1 MAG: hypothetical protein A2463_03740 [Candidatus Staskawiczbacteria bacterium RIFOXYC2_FULL_32_10]OGZ88511.1 MAG: hypothetical protein A2561_01580 [Candidatus Staskawiczbacte